MKQLLLLAVALLVGHVWSQPCAPEPEDGNVWLSPINLQGPRYEPTFKPLHVFSFLDGGEGLLLENTGDTVWITYPVRPNIHTNPPNLTDIVISKGPLADHYTADHVEFRWGPETMPRYSSSSSSTGGAPPSSGTTDSSSSSSGGFLFLEENARVTEGAQAEAGAAAQAGEVRNAWGSDHGISGRYFPLEMQVYFYNTKYKSYQEALDASPQAPDWRDVNEDVVALSILFEVGEQNEELVKITDRLELIRTDGAQTPILAKMCFEKILNKGRDYITYPGSQTRAPCKRGIRWIVLVQPLTISESQLEQFRLINLDAPLSDWEPPVDQDLVGRPVQTNLKQLPLDDKFIPAFHPHGPPLKVKVPAVGGTIVNPHAKDAEDAAYKNYWSPFDYTIVDDSDAPPAVATGPVFSTGDEAGGDTADATGGDADTAGGGGATPDSAPGLLMEQGGSSSGGGGGGDDGGDDTAGVISGGEEETAASSTANAPQKDDHKVVIPHIFNLDGTAMYTPDFAPKQHKHEEDNHYHPPSEDTDTLPDDADTETMFRALLNALNPGPAPAPKNAAAAPQVKLEVASTKKAVDPKTAFQNGKRANKQK